MENTVAFSGCEGDLQEGCLHFVKVDTVAGDLQQGTILQDNHLEIRLNVEQPVVQLLARVVVIAERKPLPRFAEEETSIAVCPATEGIVQWMIVAEWCGHVDVGLRVIAQLPWECEEDGRLVDGHGLCLG